MNIIKTLKNECKTFSRLEKTFFLLVVIIICTISVVLKDTKIALISSIFGISYTIFAGKGKIYCYFFGIVSTLCYSYLSFKNNLFGNFSLNLFYYLPSQIIGIFKWREHLKKDSLEIVKEKLTKKEKILYSIFSFTGLILGYFILKYLNDTSPLLDSTCTVLSIIGMLLTVRRALEQWYIWIIVNGLSAIMWIIAYLKGSHCFATVLMWSVYFIVAIYFLKKWRRELG